MPWKAKNQQEQRYDLVRSMQAGRESIAELSGRWRVSRKTAYKWLRRYRQKGLRGLADQNRQPKRVPLRTSRYWLERLRRLRKKRPTWGVRKLRHWLKRGASGQVVPAEATLGRWLKRWGLARGRRRRWAGPEVVRPAVQAARAPNAVWTVDFKGWYRTGDGVRVDPLTVRDLHSRYGLAIMLLRSQGIKETRRAFEKIFRRHGLPERIRCDNGTPFGAVGPTGLTRLSAWWLKLGIAVDFITPGRPCENGAHEQFHRVYKNEVAKVPAVSRMQQQRKSNAWLRDYNENRPHETLKMAVPAAHYRASRRAMPKGLKAWKYPARWERRWVKGNGEISWRGRRRFVGEAFVRDYVGLKPVRRGIWRVYFGPKVVGDLHEKDEGNIRTVRYRKRGKSPVAQSHSGSLRSPP